MPRRTMVVLLAAGAVVLGACSGSSDGKADDGKKEKAASTTTEVVVRTVDTTLPNEVSTTVASPPEISGRFITKGSCAQVTAEDGTTYELIRDSTSDQAVTATDGDLVVTDGDEVIAEGGDDITATGMVLASVEPLNCPRADVVYAFTSIAAG